MNRNILAAVLFLAAAVATNAESVQTISDPNVFTSLDTLPKQHSWWITDGSVDPESVDKDARKESAENPGGSIWKRVSVPLGNPNTPDLFPNRARGSLHVWYFKNFRLEKLPSQSTSFLIGTIDDRDRIFLNGKLVGGSGEFGAKVAQGYDRRRIYEIPANLLQVGFNTLMIQVEGHTSDIWGIYQYKTGIGPTRMIVQEESDNAYRALLFLVCYFVVGLYFLVLFLRRRQQRANLIFALFCLILVTYNALRNQLRFELGITFIELKRAEYILLYGLVPVFYYFLRTYYTLPKNKFVTFWDIFVILPVLGHVYAIYLCFASNDTQVWWVFQRDIVQIYCWSILILGMLGILLYRTIQKDKDAVIMFFATLFLVVGMVTDIISNRGLINIPSVFQYVFILFILTMASVLANSFVRLHHASEDLKENLEKRIEERTQQLQLTLEQAHRLKEMQDGDYFLTSLLIRPLSGIFGQMTKLHPELLVAQKKKFEFRKWKADLGGDLCIVDEIKLREKSYLVFINGDAMGKSMQGAGGALVMGTVFQSVLSRAKRTGQNSFPEEWIRDCYADLQRVFVAFNGSMLASAVIGLVDPESKVLYHVNVEHPAAVLYRSGKAFFFEKDALIRKFGVEGSEKDLMIQVNSFQAGDVLFVGSDGKDDLVLGQQADGTRIINDDAEVFLRCVESAQGNLQQLKETLLAKGALMDDLSIIRVECPSGDIAPTKSDSAAIQAQLRVGLTHFKKREPALALKEFESVLAKEPNEQALELLARCHLALKDYKKASKTLSAGLDEFPANTRLIYLAMRAFKGNGEYKRAIDAAERLRLREPGHVKNLVHLGDLYRRAGKKNVAKNLVGQALRHDPNHGPALRLRDLLLGAVLFFAVSFGVRAEEVVRVSNPLEPTSLSGQWSVTLDEIDPLKESALSTGEKSEETESSTASWKDVSTPGSHDEFIAGGPVTYRKIIQIDQEPTAGLALNAGYILDRDRVYWNGTLVGSTGDWDAASAQAFDRRRIYELPGAVKGKNILIVQTRPFGSEKGGMVRGPITIGPLVKAIKWAQLADFSRAILCVAYCSIGAYFLFLFTRRREEKENFFFGLFCFLLGLHTLIQSQLKYRIHPSLLLWKRAEFTLLFALAPQFHLFIRAYFPERRGNYKKALDIAVGIACGILVLALAHIWLSDNVSHWNAVRKAVVYPIAFGIIAFAASQHLWIRFKSGNTDALYLMIAIGIWFVGVLIHLLYVQGISDSGVAIYVANTLLVLSAAFIPVNRFVRLHEDVERLNRHLESRVEERTNELNNSLSTVRSLKEQQDADYFLTTLLLEPLSGSRLKDARIGSSILIKQKKSFDFRKWRAEIGGDLCIVDEIVLLNRTYAVFLNADAMGKSMQGAGGALVLGTVFQSLIARTQSSDQFQKQTPETWLRECYEELENVFVTFDGSMLISAFFGLIDLETRQMFYINSEHPLGVLFRGGKAEFLPLETMLMKIGVRIGLTQQELVIHTFQLRQGDILVAGSDGRDDIMIGGTDDDRIINSDETVFLKIVEDAGADLGVIHKELLARGQITDDLSLLRLDIR